MLLPLMAADADIQIVTTRYFMLLLLIISPLFSRRFRLRFRITLPDISDADAFAAID